jgi:hypothetical protein
MPLINHKPLMMHDAVVGAVVAAVPAAFVVAAVYDRRISSIISRL